MEKMTVHAHAKINWALRITGRRENGYHELDMLMQEIDLHDTLTLAPADETRLLVNGEPDALGDRNLILRAVNALELYTGRELKVHIDLEKRIPARAGLGGGSSDCAAALKAINEMFCLRLSTEELAGIGVKLGADVPFFIYGGFCRVKGIGENICPLSHTPKCVLVIKHAGSGLSTPDVFRLTDELSSAQPGGLDEELVSALCKGDYAQAALHSVNDLEPAAFALEPQTLTELNALRGQQGAVYARMSGSGSAVYAVFGSIDEAKAAAECVEGAFVAETV